MCTKPADLFEEKQRETLSLGKSIVIFTKFAYQTTGINAKSEFDPHYK